MDTPKPTRHLLDANHRFAFACALAVLIFIAFHHYSYAVQVRIGVGHVCPLRPGVLAWRMILREDPYEVRREAKFQDASAPFIFVITLMAAAMSLFAVILVLGTGKNLPPIEFTAHIILSLSAIAFSWLLVHTIFSIHYARLYYIDAPKKKRDAIEGGLEFPGDEKPDYIDFAYFSFVIGMTSQVSDVQISSKIMRRMATVHGIISFAFNTAILAMFVNIVASLI